MKITDPGTEALQGATAGDLAALDRVLLAIQPGVFNLAMRMLGSVTMRPMQRKRSRSRW